MKHKVMPALFYLAGGLWIIAALRDIFAPGFFSMSPRVMSATDIGGEVAVGILFLIVGLSFRKRGPRWNHK
ncbi:MAG: hypothetical protein JWM21_3248 [Acidobacteria bacterium]|nr:hypothetical protein [Acidobacteriota bacterium]